MKRDIVFQDVNGPIAIALGIDLDRALEHEKMVEEMIQKRFSLAQIVTAMNDKGDLTDAEWATLLYMLGYHQGRTGQ